MARPFMCTVQAPHCAVSQPTCVPVSSRCSAQEVHEQGAGIDRLLHGPCRLTVMEIGTSKRLSWLMPATQPKNISRGEKRRALRPIVRDPAVRPRKPGGFP